MPGSFAIECFQDGLPDYAGEDVVVAVDVIRATTTAVTAVHQGRRCYPAASLEMAVPLAARLSNPLLVGELGGNMPYGWDLTNSPADVAERTDTSRPMLLLSTSGTRLLWVAAESAAVYVACLRNYRAQIARLVDEAPKRVLLVGAGSRGQFREEDQLCCAWIGAGLIRAGFAAEGEAAAVVERWADSPAEALLVSDSITYLRNTGQTRDLEFILAHVGDVDAVFRFQKGEIIREQLVDGAAPPVEPDLEHTP